MSAPTQQQSQQNATTPINTTAVNTQPSPQIIGQAPAPMAKPTISSPGSYMSSFSGNATIPTAGIHGVNKTHEKPAIAARPIPPPTLPKYSTSFSKSDRDRNEFATGSIKLDKVEREKVNNFLSIECYHEILSCFVLFAVHYMEIQN